MIIETHVDYKIENYRQKQFINKIFGKNSNIGDVFKVDIRLLNTTRFRGKRVLCKCDDCGKEIYRKISTINNKINENSLNSFEDVTILCESCCKKAERNPQYGKPISAAAKKKLSEKLSGTNNPFFGKTHSIETRKRLSESLQGNKNHLGHKYTKEQSERMSIIVSEGYANGTRVKSHGNAKSGIYNGIKYQGSYELDFLKFCEINKILHLISKPKKSILYIGDDNCHHHYIPDFYIEKLDTIIEIKSQHYMDLNKNNNYKKFEACKKLHNFILIIDKKYEDFLNLINNKINENV